jgi:hypothetical protein
MGMHIDTGHTLHIIFHIHIEQGLTNRRNLVNVILRVEELTSTAEVLSIVHALQEIYLVFRKYLFFLQDSVEAVAIDSFIGSFVVY